MNVTDILPRVLPYVRGCPSPVAAMAIVDAMREFATETYLWEASLAAVLTVADDAVITLVPPTDSEVVILEKLTVDGEETTTYHFTRPRTVVLNEAPTIGGLEVVATTILAPAYGSAVVQEVFEPHIEGIAAGAIGRLSEQVGTAWHNMDVHAYRMGQFRQAITAATAHRCKQGRDEPLRVTAW